MSLMSAMSVLPEPDPLTASDPVIGPSGGPQCTATSRRTGQRCGANAVPGATVCGWHGGRAPQVQRSARLRLLELVDPAIATLAREMATATNSSDRQRAANSILDRAGVTRESSADPAAAQALLLTRLLALRESGQLPPGLDTVPGETVKESDGD